MLPKPLRKKIPVMIFASLTMSVFAAASDVVLWTKDFNVTTQDFDRYLEEQGVTGQRRDRALSKPGAVKAVFENLYLVRAFAAQGEDNQELDHDQIKWMVEDYHDRLLMKKQIKFEVDAELSTKNWDAMAEEEYKANRAQYQTGERVNADHILVSFTDRSEQEAEARVKQVLVRLNAGEDFTTLAQEYSDDPGSAEKGGALGFFPRKKMVKPFEDVAFSLDEPGEISAPVKTDFGYHIIRLNERKPSRQLSLEEVKPRIIPRLKKRVGQSISKAKIAEVKNSADDLGMELNLPLLEEIEQRYSPTAELMPKKR